MEHDLRLVRVWAQKVRDRESQLYYQHVHHTEARTSKAAEAASHLFSPGHQHVRFHFVATDEQTTNRIFTTLTDLITAISNKYRVRDTSQAPPPSWPCGPP